MKAKDLIAALQKFDGEIEVLVLAGNNCHPIEAAYKDDAPFSNMNCVFVQADLCVLAMRILGPPGSQTTQQKRKNMQTMRAKLVVNSVQEYKELMPGSEGPGKITGMRLVMNPVSASNYGPDGEDENNTFARYTPNGEVSLYISNPNLFGKFTKGQMFYADFTECR